MVISSPRLLAAIKALGLARHELIEALLGEQPGKIVVRKGRGYAVVVGKGGSPALVVGKVAYIQRVKSPAPSPASE